MSVTTEAGLELSFNLRVRSGSTTRRIIGWGWGWGWGAVVAIALMKERLRERLRLKEYFATYKQQPQSLIGQRYVC